MTLMKCSIGTKDMRQGNCKRWRKSYWKPSSKIGGQQIWHSFFRIGGFAVQHMRTEGSKQGDVSV